MHLDDRRYRRPLERDARALAERLPDAEVVLLGSIASDKYVDLLVDIFEHRLLFPVDFVGRGDMSRGGLLLRSARSGRSWPTARSAAPSATARGRRASRGSRGSRG